MLPQVIFLAGGANTRFFPLREKLLYRFFGKTLVFHQISRFIKQGFKKIIIVTNKDNNSQIKKEARKAYSRSKTIIQKGKGIAGAALTGLSLISSNQPVLIVNMNDLFHSLLFDAFFKKLKSNTRVNYLIGNYQPDYFPGGYLVLQGNQVKKILEKPGEGNEPSKHVKLVFDYFPEPGKLKKALKTVKSKQDDVYEVALSQMMKAKQNFQLIRYKKDWQTIKFPWHVLSVMNFFLFSIKKTKISKDTLIDKTARIKGKVIIEPGAKIFEYACIKGPAYIGKNSVVGNNALVREAMVGNNCVIGYSTEVARSYIGDNCWFHSNYIGDSVLENDIAFGAGAITANLRHDRQTIKVNVRCKKIDTQLKKLGAIVGSNAKIGINCSLYPGVKIGQNCFLAPGVVLKQDLPDGRYISTKQEHKITKNTALLEVVRPNLPGEK